MWIQLDEDGDLQISFSYDEGLVALVKTLPEKRWRKVDKCWIVPRAHAAIAVERLQPLGFAVAPDVMVLASDPDAPAPPPNRPDLTVSELNERAAEAIDRAFSGSVWIVGEMFDVSRARRVDSQGTLRFSLVQREGDGGEVARVRAVLFAQARTRIERRLREAGQPFALDDEVPVRVRARPSLYAPGGSFQIIVDDLDIAYTLGDVARRREEILRRLIAEGLHAKNPSLAIPGPPLRVGLITRAESDAFHDVLQTLRDSGFAFDVRLADVRVQGRAAEPTILRALAWFGSHADEVDVVIICRGGGSRIDLSAFDSEALARAVAALQVPVVVGVGHEQDRSVLDACARSVRTPVAAAELLVEEVERFERAQVEAAADAVRIAQGRIRAGADSLGRTRRELVPMARAASAIEDRALLRAARSVSTAAAAAAHSAHREERETRHALETATRRCVDQEQARLQAGKGWMRAAVAQRMAQSRRDLVGTTSDLFRTASERIAAASAGHDSAARQIELAHPKRVLEMGYAILRLPGGAVVRSVRTVRTGDALGAQLADGSLSLEVAGAAPDPGDNGGKENA